MRYEIKNALNKTYYYRNELKEFGCRFKKTGQYSGYWYINTEDQFLANRLQAFCNKNHLAILEGVVLAAIILSILFLYNFMLSVGGIITFIAHLLSSIAIMFIFSKCIKISFDSSNDEDNK